MKRLLHCPFCGEEEDLMLSNIPAEGMVATYVVFCRTCGAHGPEATSTNSAVAQDTAVNDWNNRLPHDQDLAKRISFALE